MIRLALKSLDWVRWDFENHGPMNLKYYLKYKVLNTDNPIYLEIN